MKKLLLLDTNVWIDYLRGYPEAVRCVDAQAEAIILSTVVAAELYAGARDDEDTRPA